MTNDPIWQCTDDALEAADAVMKAVAEAFATRDSLHSVHGKIAEIVESTVRVNVKQALEDAARALRQRGPECRDDGLISLAHAERVVRELDLDIED